MPPGGPENANPSGKCGEITKGQRVLRRPAVCKKTRFPKEKAQGNAKRDHVGLPSFGWRIPPRTGVSSRKSASLQRKARAEAAFFEKTIGREQLSDENLRAGRILLLRFDVFLTAGATFRQFG